MKSLMMFVVLVFLASAAGADKSARLKVSATIPPRACEYPKYCKPTAGHLTTRMAVRAGAVSYVGSVPVVSKKNGMLVVTF